jgi:predicted trehalose synthase
MGLLQSRPVQRISFLGACGPAHGVHSKLGSVLDGNQHAVRQSIKAGERLDDECSDLGVQLGMCHDAIASIGKDQAMPVEEHPAYPEWRHAIDELKKAADAYDTCCRQNAPNAEVVTARSQLAKAQALYDKARDKIGLVAD